MALEPIPIESHENWSALWEQMQSSEFRRSFLNNPEESLRGIGASDLPSELTAALAELSPAELRLLADLANRFRLPEGPNGCLM